MATLSAHTDEKTASQVSDMARAEDRTPSQITAAAVRWYVRLPQRARDAMRRMEAQEEDAIDEVVAAITRAIYNVQYDRAVRSWAARTPATLPPDASEEDILAEAVRLTKMP